MACTPPLAALSEPATAAMQGQQLFSEALNVGDCASVASNMHRDEATGALHHDIEPELLKRMRSFYADSNQRLYRFLGRDLGW